MEFHFLRKCITSIPNLNAYFRGIITKFDIDMCQNRLGFWIFYSPNNKMGIGHFVCIFESDNSLFLFDSYGRAPEKFGLPQMQFNPYSVQPLASCSCAAFVLFFAFHSINRPCQQVVNQFFNKSSTKNEDLVLKWLNQFINLPTNLRVCQE